MTYLRGISIFAMGMVLIACSGGKIVKTYEGDALAEAEVAVLLAEDHIEVTRVNGKKLTKYLLKSNSTRYGLKEGKNTVEFNYVSIWSIPIKNDDDPRAEEVKSATRQVEIFAKPGQRLRFRHQNASDIRMAKRLIEDFDAEIIDAQGNVLAVSGEVKDVALMAKTSSIAPAAAATATATLTAPVTASVDPDFSSLDALKAIWENANATEKKEFLRWAFQ